MNCRVPGCSKIEWMARELCDGHWRMLPEQLQLDIRNTLRQWRLSGSDERQQLRAGLDALYVKALAFIEPIEQANRERAVINLFRTRMAAIAGIVASLRQLPIEDLRVQLAVSVEELRRDFPGDYAKKELQIAQDLEILELLIETRVKLGEIIYRYAPPAPTAEDTAGNEVTVP